MTTMQRLRVPRDSAALASVVLVLSGLLGCFRSPDLDNIKCLADESCPSGYFCAAVYDLWFAKSSPIAGSYDDAPAGALMIWLYKPAGHIPLGSVTRTASITGDNWYVYVGPRGTTGTGTDDANRPVVSYVAQDSPVASLAGNLEVFINDAVANGAADMAAASTSQAFSGTWYLTDVFGGFQIWTGSDATGLQCTGYSCVVQ